MSKESGETTEKNIGKNPYALWKSVGVLMFLVVFFVIIPVGTSVVLYKLGKLVF